MPILPSRTPREDFTSVFQKDTLRLASSRLDEEGRDGRSSPNVRRGCDGRLGDARDHSCGRTALRRTAKSCGPETPTLVSSLRDDRERRGQESPVPGESSKDTVKAITQGMPVVPAEPVVTAACFFLLQAGNGCGQHPAFPAPSSISRVPSAVHHSGFSPART
jgi:hypothetical protein